MNLVGIIIKNYKIIKLKLSIILCDFCNVSPLLKDNSSLALSNVALLDLKPHKLLEGKLSINQYQRATAMKIPYKMDKLTIILCFKMHHLHHHLLHLIFSLI